MNDIEHIHGTIEKIVFQNNDASFSVGRLIKKGELHSIVICGSLPPLFEGQEVLLSGSWTTHQKYGKQFQVATCSPKQPTTHVGIERYLSSGVIKGIGKTYARRLVDYFGVSVLEVLDTEPEKLLEVPGIGKKRVEQIISAWEKQKSISHIMVFLQEKGISPTYAMKLYKQYGADTIAIVTENPYRLAEEMWGVGFKLADRIAQQLGIALDSLHRIKAAIYYYLGNIASEGHLYAPLDTLRQEVASLLAIELNEQALISIKRGLHALYSAQKIKIITYNEIHYIGLSSHYYAEFSIANKVKDMLAMQPTYTFTREVITEWLAAANAHSLIVLHELQQQGIISALEKKITIITGGPGTGKTTLIKTLINILERVQCSYKLAAPTGRAAKRMSEGTVRYAETIHRLLGFDPSTMSFTRNEKSSLVVDFLIVDEASMIDIFLGNALMRALPYHAHLIFLGDVDQLPSVGAGNLLHDLIESGTVSCVRLNTIFRQAAHSLIVVNAHKVNSGTFPVTHQEDAKHDFIIIKEDNPEEIEKHLLHIIRDILPRHGIALQDTMVLSPMHRGIVGTQTLNGFLQRIYLGENVLPTIHNTPQNLKSITLLVGDRVMQIRNNYDKNVFNGEIGFVTYIDHQEDIIRVSYGDKIIDYEDSERDEIVLAYAISVHKSQGSEYKAVIMPVFTHHFTLLQRTILYTAITRAKQLCILVGQSKAIAMAVKNNPRQKRISFLAPILRNEIVCQK